MRKTICTGCNESHTILTKEICKEKIPLCIYCVKLLEYANDAYLADATLNKDGIKFFKRMAINLMKRYKNTNLNNYLKLLSKNLNIDIEISKEKIK